MWTLIASVLLAQALATDAANELDGGVLAVDAGPAFPLRFEGNLVMPDAVYAAVVDLPLGAVADQALAERVAAQLEAFLLRSGYELAQVTARVEGDGLAVHIDEGQLEKVVFRGRFTLPMLRFKLALDLPKDVFNRPHLEGEVLRQARALGIAAPTWALVETRSVKHEDAQLEETRTLVLAGRSLIRRGQRFELHFTFGEPPWSTGVGLDVRTSWLDGLELGVNYQSRSVALRDDRWRFAFTGGLALRNDLPRNNVYVFPSRLAAEILWYSGALDEQGTTRALLMAHGEGFFRQRRDFGLENYSAMRNEFSANLVSRLHPAVSLEAGAGVQYFLLGALVPGEGEARPLPASALGPPSTHDELTRLRAFGGARLELTFFDGGSRWDRRHALALEARLSGNLTRVDLPPFLEARLKYQLVIPFGWHDLWLRVKGTWMSGDVLFPFEEVMGEHLPAVFADLWLRRAAGLRVEYRHSLARDIVKVGLFANGLSFAEEDRDTGQAALRFGLGAGPTAHLLIEGFFQLDFFLNFAVLSNGRFSTGLLVWLNKVF